MKNVRYLLIFIFVNVKVFCQTDRVYVSNVNEKDTIVLYNNGDIKFLV